MPSEFFKLVVIEFKLITKSFRFEVIFLRSLDDIESVLPDGYRIYRLNRQGELDRELNETWNCVALDVHSSGHKKVLESQSSRLI